MKPNRLFAILFFVLLFTAGPLVNPLAAEEMEGESIGVIIQRSGMTPELQLTVIDLFDHIHHLENSFRNGQWDKASLEVDRIDLFYSRILKISEEMNFRVELGYLQAFEFSLTEINRGINRRDRELVEKRFIELQPELFDILDKFTSVPMRLTASRFYIDLAIKALEDNRYDIALDELGEISAYMKDMKESLAAEKVDMAALYRQLDRARQMLEKKDGDSRQVLENIRRLLEQAYQSFSLK